MARSKSSERWLREHEQDPWVKRAREQGYRSRASFKLLEIQEKYQVIRPGGRVVDLGAAPGGWSQVAAAIVGAKGTTVALDLLDIEPMPDVTFIQGDFCDNDVLERLLQTLGGEQVDLVISDMAPNLSGNRAIDQPQASHLVELAIDLTGQVLKPGGSLVTKAFEGTGIEEIRKGYRDRFGRVNNFKPQASRDRSREIYLIGRDYFG